MLMFTEIVLVNVEILYSPTTSSAMMEMLRMAMDVAAFVRSKLIGPVSTALCQVTACGTITLQLASLTSKEYLTKMLSRSHLNLNLKILFIKI